MKKIFALVLMVSLVSFAQIVQKGTVADSASKTFYFDVDSDVDSVSLYGIFTGEIDVDTLIVTKGLKTDGNRASSSNFVAVATPDTTILTVNNAAGVTTGVVWDGASTGLNALEGYNAFKVVIIAASAGNDATDPNELVLGVIKY